MIQKTKWLSIALLASMATLAIAVQAKQGQGGGKADQMPVFADFDLNDDGVLTEAEFYQARGERIAERAAEGRPMKHLSEAPTFSDIDTDGNGEISTSEFSAHQAEHRQQRMQGQ
jgi:Ca2+-binding EF-hand superfamily protein